MKQSQNYYNLNQKYIFRAKELISALFCNGSPKIYVETYGCQQNEADSENILGMAKELGYVQTDTKEEADLIVVNTCAVREHAELRALSNTGYLKHIKEANPNLLICVCGCMIQQEHRQEDIKKKYPYVDFVFGTNMTYRFPKMMCDVLEKKSRHFFVEDYETNHGDFVEDVPKIRKSNSSAWVSVMYGCNNFCTYCIVPYVRGRERSREPESVLAEVEELVKQGYKDITLLGQNVNSYGHDLDTKINFVDLLRMIDALDYDFTLRFMTSHPKDATHELFDFMAESKKMAHHIHLPMQSGSNRVLEAMNRRYTKEKIFEICDYVRSKIPDISITTDMIVGFPGETDEEFEETLKALETARFDNVFSFIYSRRIGTKAYNMENQISEETKKYRMKRLLDKQAEIAGKINEKMLGKQFSVIVDGESKTDKNVLAGRTNSGKTVHFPKADGVDIMPGDDVIVEITKAGAFTIHAKYISKRSK